MRSVLLALPILVAVASLPAAQRPAPPARTMAITIDDLPYVHRAADGYLPAAQRGTAAILAALKNHGAPAVGFVVERQLEAVTAAERAVREGLLEQWVAAGHILGNHTFSHPDANRLTVDAYLAEIDKARRPRSG